MGKYSHLFEIKCNELYNDVESKIGALILRNPIIKKVELDIPSFGVISGLAIAEDERGFRFVEFRNKGYIMDMKKYCSLKQAIDILEKIEEVIDSENSLA